MVGPENKRPDTGRPYISKIISDEWLLTNKYKKIK